MTMAAASTAVSPEDAERFRSFERQRHDNLAMTYRDFFTPITALAIKPLFDAIRLQRGVDLLDVATGPGSLAAEAHRLGAKTVGVDLSLGMIELAEKSYPGIDFRVAEVEHLPFADCSFDAVVCNFGLGHFPYPEASVAECIRTLSRPAELPCLGGTIRANNGYRASFAKQLLRSESPRHLTYLRAIRFSDFPILMSSVTCLKGLAWLKSWCRATTQLI
jgi:SAM-dependent methyltransferase